MHFYGFDGLSHLFSAFQVQFISLTLKSSSTIYSLTWYLCSLFLNFTCLVHFSNNVCSFFQQLLRETKPGALGGECDDEDMPKKSNKLLQKLLMEDEADDIEAGTSPSPKPVSMHVVSLIVLPIYFYKIPMKK